MSNANNLCFLMLTKHNIGIRFKHIYVENIGIRHIEKGNLKLV